MTAPGREAVGPAFDPALMQQARQRSWAVLRDLRDRMRPGIDEPAARAMAEDVFRAHGVERLWHQPVIRIGRDTTKTYRQPADPAVRLAEDDIFFIDLGLVFAGHEGDVGETFAIGEAPGHRACAAAARSLFGEVAHAWRTRGLSGQALYDFAGARAEAMGWRFNHAIKGHRLGDFPHAVHKAGNLGTLDGTPSSGLWVLEIQIVHPTGPFGAFYEDLLTA